MKRAKREKTKKEEIGKQITAASEDRVNGNGLTARQLGEIRKRKPLEAMIANGKDRSEASVLFFVNQLMEEHFWEDDPKWGPFEKLSDTKKANLRSLKSIARTIVSWLKHSDDDDYSPLNPKYGVPDPTIASYWQEFGRQDRELNGVVQEVWKILSRRPKLRAQLDELVYGSLARHQELCLIIGFCAGMKAYKIGLKRSLNNLTMANLENFSIKFPREADNSIAKKIGIII